MLWRRRPSQTEQTIPVDNANHSMNFPQQIPQRGPVEGPYGQRLTRRVTWRSSTYKLVAYLYLLCVLYILWLIRDLFFLPFSSTSATSTSDILASTTDGYVNGLSSCHVVCWSGRFLPSFFALFFFPTFHPFHSFHSFHSLLWI